MDIIRLMIRDLSDPVVATAMVGIVGGLVIVSIKLIMQKRLGGLAVLVIWYLYYAIPLPNFGATRGLLLLLLPALIGWLILAIFAITGRRS